MDNPPNFPHLEILMQDLHAGAEDEQDYKAPEKGNLVYKMYSLQDLLLMVRSSVSLTHTRRVGSGKNQVDMLVYTFIVHVQTPGVYAAALFLISVYALTVCASACFAQAGVPVELRC